MCPYCRVVGGTPFGREIASFHAICIGSLLYALAIFFAGITLGSFLSAMRRAKIAPDASRECL
jgi:hypothetical protein